MAEEVSHFFPCPLWCTHMNLFAMLVHHQLQGSQLLAVIVLGEREQYHTVRPFRHSGTIPAMMLMGRVLLALHMQQQFMSLSLLCTVSWLLCILLLFATAESAATLGGTSFMDGPHA